MKIIGATTAILVGFLLLAAIGYAGVAAFEYLGTQYQGLEPQVARVTTIATVVAVFCALMIAGGLKSGGQGSVSSEKIAIYQQLLVHWGERLKGAQETEGRMAGDINGLEQCLALHGSQKVIAAYLSLRRSAGQGGKTSDDLQELLKKLLIEMRADIGRTEFGTDKKELLDLLLGRR